MDPYPTDRPFGFRHGFVIIVAMLGGFPLAIGTITGLFTENYTFKQGFIIGAVVLAFSGAASLPTLMRRRRQ